MPNQIAYIRSADIQSLAEQVLAEHQPGGGIPVLIDDIVEFGFGVEIRPMRGLQARFEFEGSITCDLQTIVVDEGMMQQYPNRYRFTLAHELGHKILHNEFIDSLEIGDAAQWKTAVAEIGASDYGRMEHQAYIFAGCLLVPSHSLAESCSEAKILAEKRGIDLSAMGSGAIGYVAGRIAKDYIVSTAVMERRITAEQCFSYED